MRLTQAVGRLTVLAMASACGGANLPYRPGEASACPVPFVERIEAPDGQDRRIENIELALRPGGEAVASATGDALEIGGVWGDGEAVVVAVLDCDDVEGEVLAELALGSELLHLIEVNYSFEEVNAIRSELVRRADASGIDASVLINSTPNGRLIEFRTPDLARLPSDLEDDIDPGLVTFVEGATFSFG